MYIYIYIYIYKYLNYKMYCMLDVHCTSQNIYYIYR